MNWAPEARTLEFLMTWHLRKGELRLNLTAWKMGCWLNKKAEAVPARVEMETARGETLEKVALLDGSGILCFPSFHSPALLKRRANIDLAFIRLYFKCRFGAYVLPSARSPCQVAPIGAQYMLLE